MDQSGMRSYGEELNEQYIEQYLDSGMFDHLQDPVRFSDFMKNRHWYHTSFYLKGITGLEGWYGDKSYKKYSDWFLFLDRMLTEADNMFNSFWEPQGVDGLVKKNENI